MMLGSYEWIGEDGNNKQGPVRVRRRAVGKLTAVAEVSVYFERVSEEFPRPAQAETILPVHVVRMQLDLSFLPNHPGHVSGFGGQDRGVLELDTMSPADTVFGHGQSVWTSQTKVPVVLLDPGVNGTASLPNVNLTTLAGYSTHTWRFESQESFTGQRKLVIFKELIRSGVTTGWRGWKNGADPRPVGANWGSSLGT
jgi:hypothetical protein